MPGVTNEEIKQVDKKLEYIGLNLKEIPNNIKNNKLMECNLIKEYRDTTYKVYKYIDVNDVQIFITQEPVMANVQKKCKSAIPIGEYLIDKDLKQNFLQMVENIDMEALKELENEQNKFDISYPYSISYKNALKWRVYYSKTSRKYFMLVSYNEKDIEAMFLLLKKQIQSNKEKVAIKIYVPVANEGYSENFLSNSQITDIENNLWFFTKKWPRVYEVIDIYGTRTMHIIGKSFICENIESYYKIFIKEKKDAIEKYELLKELFLIESNLKEEYHFNIKIDEKGLFQIYLNEKEITLNNMNEFLKTQVEEKITKFHEIINNMEQLETSLKEKREELDEKNEEYNNKQKQIVTFLQCKKTFLGRFKYFFKSNKKNKKIIKVPQIKGVKLLQDDDESEVFEKKDFYYIEDLLAICNILNKKVSIYNSKEQELKTATEKIQNLEQKIKNADLFITEIESHKKSIFEFWKFTNKDLPNELTEAEKRQKDNEQTSEKKFNFLQDAEELEKLMDNAEVNKLSKNEMDAVFAVKDYINIIDILNKKEIAKNDEKYIEEVLELEKEQYEKEKSNQNIIYYDVKQNINIHIKEEKKNITKDKYKILNFDSNMNVQEFKEQLLKQKKILEKAYNKINIPFDIPVYSVLKNNRMYEWSITNLNLQDEIKNEEAVNVDIIKYNVPKGSSALFYTNHVVYLNDEKNGNTKEKLVLLNFNEFEISLKGKHKEIVNIQDNNFQNIIKTIKIYEYDLKQKVKTEKKEDEN